MLNNISIMGRLTKAPELKYTASNKPVLSFTIANDSGFGDNKQTDFIDCVAWNKTAEFISQYFDRGDLIILAGKLTTRTWQDQNGNNRKTTEVLVGSVDFGGKKREAIEGAQTSPAQPQPQKQTPPPMQVDYDPRAEQEVDEQALPFDIY